MEREVVVCCVCKDGAAEERTSDFLACPERDIKCGEQNHRKL